MREIEFRGKRKDTNQWIFGNLIEDNHPNVAKVFIHYNSIEDIWKRYSVEVIPETIGQLIGKKDIKDKNIYEGDIFKFKFMEELNRSIELIGSFCWNDQDLCYEIDIYSPEYPEYVCLSYIDNGQMYNFEIIGNKYDNPELIKE
jgi:uncharacterized phage protein (TIGR01671 family)